ncbi:MAG: peptide-methionine (S)-S-oxide reductase MsrA [Rhodobacteraceae bacterium]|nr:peptide-methionine (S)-S-oxide reductase MsrA [Paracoccaceae bacterium]
MLSFLRNKARMPEPGNTLPGRNTPIATSAHHHVNGNPLKGPFPSGHDQALFGMGCFWGVERLFWGLEGVWVTSVGYTGGHTPNPTYEEVCTGQTGHNEVTQIVFDPAVIPYPSLLRVFWESHDPTQGMRQGNDVGTQYRSGIYCSTEHHLQLATASRVQYAAQLRAAGLGDITTEIQMAPDYYLAEDYHQQYLAKVPGGYCSMRGTGVVCPPEEPAP